MKSKREKSSKKGKSMQHYVMTCEGADPGTMLSEGPNAPDTPWMDGKPIRETFTEPFVFFLDPEYPGEMMAMYEVPLLLMRDDLLKALKDSGVDNLQTYPAIIQDKVKKKEYKNYSAVNLVGVVSCADPAKSRKGRVTDSEMIDAFFESLVIDEAKTKGALMFRLAESVGAIIASDRVKAKIEAAGIPYMVFYGPGEWAG
jgi:hypothetical protein